jgi:hypothetical protein
MSRNILLIQSDPEDADAVRGALISGHDPAFVIEWLKLCTAGLERLESEYAPGNRGPGAIAAIMLDLFLPDSEGLQTFDRVFRAAAHIQILLCARPTTKTSRGWPSSVARRTTC